MIIFLNYLLQTVFLAKYFKEYQILAISKKSTIKHLNSASRKSIFWRERLCNLSRDVTVDVEGNVKSEIRENETILLYTNDSLVFFLLKILNI